MHLVAREHRVDDAMDVLRDRTLLRTGRLGEVLLERQDRGEDLLGRGRHLLELARREPAVVADGGVADELADLLRVLGRDLPDELDEEVADEAAHVLERRQPLLLGPVREAAGPEVVVLVEVPLLALREVLATAREAVLERGECLILVDLDPAGLAGDLILERLQVARALLVVDRRDDRRREVEDLLELARSDVEQVADPARHALEEPDVRDRSGEVDVTHALAANLLPRHLDAAALADDPLVADALVLAAVALPVPRRPEDALAEQAVPLRLQRAVVDRLRLGDLARRPVADLLARGEPDPNRIEIIDVDQPISPPVKSLVKISGTLAPRLTSSLRSFFSGSRAGGRQSSSSRSTRSLSPSGPTSASASSSASSPSDTSTSSRSPSDSSAGRASSPSWSTRSWPSSTSSAVGWRPTARSEPGERSIPSSSAARRSSSSSSRTSTSRPSSERTWTSSASDCISFSSTLKDSGIDGSAMFSPLTIASYAFTRPTVSSDLIVSISCNVYAAP